MSVNGVGGNLVRNNEYIPLITGSIHCEPLRVKGEFNVGRGVEVGLESKQVLELSLMTAKKGTPGLRCELLGPEESQVT